MGTKTFAHFQKFKDIYDLAQTRPLLPQNMLPWAQIGLASRLTWCPVGWLAGGCGARAALSIERLPTL